MFPSAYLFVYSFFCLKGLLVCTSGAFNLTSTKETLTVSPEFTGSSMDTNSDESITLVSNLSQTKSDVEFKTTVNYATLFYDLSKTETENPETSKLGMYMKTQDSTIISETSQVPSKAKTSRQDVSTLESTSHTANVREDATEETRSFTDDTRTVALLSSESQSKRPDRSQFSTNIQMKTDSSSQSYKEEITTLETIQASDTYKTEAKYNGTSDGVAIRNSSITNITEISYSLSSDKTPYITETADLIDMPDDKTVKVEQTTISHTSEISSSMYIRDEEKTNGLNYFTSKHTTESAFESDTSTFINTPDNDKKDISTSSIKQQSNEQVFQLTGITTMERSVVTVGGSDYPSTKGEINDNTNFPTVATEKEERQYDDESAAGTTIITSSEQSATENESTENQQNYTTPPSVTPSSDIYDSTGQGPEILSEDGFLLVDLDNTGVQSGHLSTTPPNQFSAERYLISSTKELATDVTDEPVKSPTANDETNAVVSISSKKKYVTSISTAILPELTVNPNANATVDEHSSIFKGKSTTDLYRNVSSSVSINDKSESNYSNTGFTNPVSESTTKESQLNTESINKTTNAASTGKFNNGFTNLSQSIRLLEPKEFSTVSKHDLSLSASENSFTQIASTANKKSNTDIESSTEAHLEVSSTIDSITSAPNIYKQIESVTDGKKNIENEGDVDMSFSTSVTDIAQINHASETSTVFLQQTYDNSEKVDNSFLKVTNQFTQEKTSEGFHDVSFKRLLNTETVDNTYITEKSISFDTDLDEFVFDESLESQTYVPTSSESDDLGIDGTSHFLKKRSFEQPSNYNELTSHDQKEVTISTLHGHTNTLNTNKNLDSSPIKNGTKTYFEGHISITTDSTYVDEVETNSGSTMSMTERTGSSENTSFEIRLKNATVISFKNETKETGLSYTSETTSHPEDTSVSTTSSIKTLPFGVMTSQTLEEISTENNQKLNDEDFITISTPNIAKTEGTHVSDISIKMTPTITDHLELYDKSLPENLFTISSTDKSIKTRQTFDTSQTNLFDEQNTPGLDNTKAEISSNAYSEKSKTKTLETSTVGTENDLSTLVYNDTKDSKIYSNQNSMTGVATSLVTISHDTSGGPINQSVEDIFHTQSHLTEDELSPSNGNSTNFNTNHLTIESTSSKSVGKSSTIINFDKTFTQKASDVQEVSKKLYSLESSVSGNTVKLSTVSIYPVKTETYVDFTQTSPGQVNGESSLQKDAYTMQTTVNDISSISMNRQTMSEEPKQNFEKFTVKNIATFSSDDPTVEIALSTPDNGFSYTEQNSRDRGLISTNDYTASSPKLGSESDRPSTMSLNRKDESNRSAEVTIDSTETSTFGDDSELLQQTTPTAMKNVALGTTNDNRVTSGNGGTLYTKLISKYDNTFVSQVDARSSPSDAYATNLSTDQSSRTKVVTVEGDTISQAQSTSDTINDIFINSHRVIRDTGSTFNAQSSTKISGHAISSQQSSATISSHQNNESSVQITDKITLSDKGEMNDNALTREYVLSTVQNEINTKLNTSQANPLTNENEIATEITTEGTYHTTNSFLSNHSDVTNRSNSSISVLKTTMSLVSDTVDTLRQPDVSDKESGVQDFTPVSTVQGYSETPTSVSSIPIFNTKPITSVQDTENTERIFNDITKDTMSEGSNNATPISNIMFSSQYDYDSVATEDHLESSSISSIPANHVKMTTIHKTTLSASSSIEDNFDRDTSSSTKTEKVTSLETLISKDDYVSGSEQPSSKVYEIPNAENGTTVSVITHAIASKNDILVPDTTTNVFDTFSHKSSTDVSNKEEFVTNHKTSNRTDHMQYLNLTVSDEITTSQTNAHDESSFQEVTRNILNQSHDDMILDNLYNSTTKSFSTVQNFTKGDLSGDVQTESLTSFVSKTLKIYPDETSTSQSSPQSYNESTKVTNSRPDTIKITESISSIPSTISSKDKKTSLTGKSARVTSQSDYTTYVANKSSVETTSSYVSNATNTFGGKSKIITQEVYDSTMNLQTFNKRETIEMGNITLISTPSTHIIDIDHQGLTDSYKVTTNDKAGPRSTDLEKETTSLDNKGTILSSNTHLKGLTTSETLPTSDDEEKTTSDYLSSQSVSILDDPTSIFVSGNIKTEWHLFSGSTVQTHHSKPVLLREAISKSTISDGGSFISDTNHPKYITETTEEQVYSSSHTGGHVTDFQITSHTSQSTTSLYSFGTFTNLPTDDRRTELSLTSDIKTTTQTTESEIDYLTLDDKYAKHYALNIESTVSDDEEVLPMTTTEEIEPETDSNTATLIDERTTVPTSYTQIPQYTSSTDLFKNENHTFGNNRSDTVEISYTTETIEKKMTEISTTDTEVGTSNHNLSKTTSNSSFSTMYSIENSSFSSGIPDTNTESIDITNDNNDTHTYMGINDVSKKITKAIDYVQDQSNKTTSVTSVPDDERGDLITVLNDVTTQSNTLLNEKESTPAKQNPSLVTSSTNTEPTVQNENFINVSAIGQSLNDNKNTPSVYSPTEFATESDIDILSTGSFFTETTKVLENGLSIHDSTISWPKTKNFFVI
ncbi:uncharacterized protein LOC132753435 [Ruditapes philippinarum]|uniref:uncharacterized protein LOC132753435 n=1 Tax=Ruditapes philippinarum TaxID=129788 RepID=UPI00295A5923|nr:uncharacterized protein LOC132753435 [Ruditapes philippinarum]